MNKVLAVILVAACGSKAPPPEPLSSKAPVALESVGPPIITTLTSARDAMCACGDTDCAHKAQEKLRVWSSEYQKASAPERDAGTESQINALFAAYDKCMTVAHGRVTEGSTIPYDCDVYEFRIYKVANCAGLPSETQHALMESYQQTKEAWASVPEEGREALGAACKAAADAIQQAAVSCDQK